MQAIADMNTTKTDDGALLSTPTCSAFELRGTRIHDTDTGNLICSIWPERTASDELEEGESWLDMRQRTKPEREAIGRHTAQRAASVCAFLNLQNDPKNKEKHNERDK